jgi:hypothetical protein
MKHSSGSPIRHRASRSSVKPARPADQAAKDAGVPVPRSRAAQLPYWIVLAGTAVALALTRERALGIRGGTLALAGILLAAALARLALPERRAGLLVSRRRLVDVPILAALGVGLLVASLVLPAQA